VLVERTMVTNAYIARKKTAVDAPNERELRSYFEYSQSGVEVVEDGLKEMTFGEFLVDCGVIDRFQLFRALQLQDRNPAVRLGECAAALGYVPILAVERMYERFANLSTVRL
jgi:hypothetical protein